MEQAKGKNKNAKEVTQKEQSMKQSQEQSIAAHLKSGKKLTAISALKLFGCFRLSGRIYTLRQQGMNIQSKIITTPSGKHVSEYKLSKWKPQSQKNSYPKSYGIHQ